MAGLIGDPRMISCARVRSAGISPAVTPAPCPPARTENLVRDNLSILSTPIATLSSLNGQPTLFSVSLPSFLVSKPSEASGGDRRLRHQVIAPSSKPIRL